MPQPLEKTRAWAGGHRGPLPVVGGGSVVSSSVVSSERQGGSVLTLKDWEGSRKALGVADVPKSAEEVFEEKVGGWSRAGANSTFKSLASNIYEGRALERNESRDRDSLNEMEKVMTTFNLYMATKQDSSQESMVLPRRSQSAASSRASSEAISVADIKLLKEQRLRAARLAAEEARAAVEAEASKYTTLRVPDGLSASSGSSSSPVRGAQPSSGTGEEIVVENGNPSATSRPRSAPGLRRNLDKAGGNILNVVRRHNAARLNLEVPIFAPFTVPGVTPDESHQKQQQQHQCSEDQQALIRMASRTQDERFGSSANNRSGPLPRSCTSHDVKDSLDAEIEHQPSGIAVRQQKTVDVAKFGKKQEDWLETVQNKRDELKREIETVQMKELRVVPDIKLTSESWERAKKEHALQAERQARIDEKILEAKILKQEQKNAALKTELLVNKSTKSKGKKIKRGSRRQKSESGNSLNQDAGPENRTSVSRHHDPDSFHLPFREEEEEEEEDDEEHKVRRLRRPGTGSRNTTQNQKIPSLPNLDSLDLISGNAPAESDAIGRRAMSARSMQREKSNGWGETPKVGAMAALGGDFILQDTKRATASGDSDRMWLESVMRKRKEDQLKKEALFEMELAAAMGTAMMGKDDLETKVKQQRRQNLKETSNATVASKSAALSLASKKSDSEDDGDILYVSDTDDESVVATCVERQQQPSTSEKLDALITDLDGLRGTLERRIASVAAPPPVSFFAAPAPAQAPAPAPASATTAPAPTTNRSLYANQAPILRESQPPVNRVPLSLDIPPTAFLLANTVKSPKKAELSSDAPPVPRSSVISARASTAAALHQQENALLSGVEIKNDPLTEILLSRASSAENGAASKGPLQRPRTTQLQSHQEIRDGQEQKRRDREFVTPLTRFFDSSSTADKGRFRLHDARDFVADSMFRKPDIINDSVTLLCGTRKDTGAQSVITVLFDRTEFSETKAREWWLSNRDRIVF